YRPMVGRAHRLAVGRGFEHGQDLAGLVGLQHIGSELVADPEGVADDLKTFGVEIGAGEITFCGVLMQDAERHLPVGIVQEDGFLPLDLAGRPVDLVAGEVEHRGCRVVAGRHARAAWRGPAALRETHLRLAQMPHWPERLKRRNRATTRAWRISFKWRCGVSCGAAVTVS